MLMMFDHRYRLIGFGGAWVASRLVAIAGCWLLLVACSTILNLIVRRQAFLQELSLENRCSVGYDRVLS